MIQETDIETIRLSQNSSHEGAHTKDQRVVKEFLVENWRLKWTRLSQVLIEFSKIKSYKKTVEPLLEDEHKAQRKNSRLERGYNDNFFSDEKALNMMVSITVKSDRIWAVNEKEANRRGGKKPAR